MESPFVSPALGVVLVVGAEVSAIGILDSSAVTLAGGALPARMLRDIFSEIEP